MATNAQIVAFVNQWKDAATRAGQALGLPPLVILGQWGMETGYGTQPNMGQNNPANNFDTHGKPINFSSQQDFVNYYVQNVKTDFPGLQPGATVPGPTLQSYLSVFNGKQSYDPAVTDYGTRVGGGVSSILAAIGQKDFYTANGAILKNVTVSDPNAIQGDAYGPGLTGNQPFWATIIDRAFGLIISVAFIFAGIWLFINGDRVEKAVKP